MNILGIDLSLNATGLAMLSLDGMNTVSLESFGKKYKGVVLPDSTVYQGCLVVPDGPGTLERWESMLLPVLEYARHAHGVFIEGYSFASHMQYARALTEFGGIVRYHLRKMGHLPIEIAPTSLKKYITGSGRADKSQMLASVRALGLPLSDHNMADAYGLAALGIALLTDSVEIPAYQREVLNAIKHPPIKKAKIRGQKINFPAVL